MLEMLEMRRALWRAYSPPIFMTGKKKREIQERQGVPSPLMGKGQRKDF